MKRNVCIVFLTTTLIQFVGVNLQAKKIEQASSSNLSKVWVADNGDGTYKNPVLYADYSDPDVCRVGEDYYMTASSFNCIPGLPILHSNDLVNWSLIGYALDKQPPFDFFNKVQHGCGVWAPCIRFHNGEFHIFSPDPDFGIYVLKAKNPAGPWSEPLLIKAGKGLIDPTPLWDEDGKAYLAYAFAGSRAGTKSVLMMCSMNPDATETYEDDVLLFDGHKDHQTVEGPKFYKRNNFYYIFAPAGGVATGWQLVLRSKNVFGPYESKIVMAQGNTKINGPHQGAWVNTVTGEDWFIHFQDQFAYGRVVHLNPMKWLNDWPVIGVDKDGDGCGEPVSSYKKPNVGKTYPLATPPESDEFDSHTMGLQWQWHANKHITWGYPSANLGYFRMNCFPKPENYVNLWQASNLLLQKFPATQFKATTKFVFTPNFDNEEFAFVVMGRDYSFLSVKQIGSKLKLYQAVCKNADKGKPEKIIDIAEVDAGALYFRVEVREGAKCQFYYSTDGKKFNKAGEEFTAREGQWIGAKVGYVALREGNINNAGYADIDWLRIEK
jgi:beta-xylosidase